MICPIGPDGYCARHRRRHIGHAREIALEASDRAEQVRLAWDGVASSGPTINLRLFDDCPHRGPLLDKTKCGVAVWACARHGTCSTARRAGVKLCQECDDFPRPPTPPKNDAAEPTRHLLFHLWPTKAVLGIWQRNLDQLKQRWSLFNGRRVIAVVTDGFTSTPEAVKDYMRGYDCEWIHLDNDPGLREVKTFWALWDRVRDCDGENHFTFYGQGKGATKPENRFVTIHRWTTAMYHTLLDYWPLVEERLKAFPVVGSFKKNVAGFPGSVSAWHYSGSFAWFRNKDLFALPRWSHIDRHWWGIESYPSLHFSAQQAGCAFFERQSGNFNLYKLAYWERVERELDAWKSANRRYCITSSTPSPA